MASSLQTILSDISRRLGDLDGSVWAPDELTVYVQRSMRELAQTLPIFFDQIPLENLPAHFSYTQPWEKLYGYVSFDYGCANYTRTGERRLLTETSRIGPAWYTSPKDVPFLSHLTNAADIPATADLPDTVTAVDRATWDGRTILALSSRHVRAQNAQYRTETGDVFGYTWREDGLRTFRKVRKPSTMAAVATIVGSWGAMRDPTDLSSETTSGTWGVPRRIPGHFATGSSLWGCPRRPYLDGTNVRVEVFRLGRPLKVTTDLCELPDRYVAALRDGAMAQALGRFGPGQQPQLAAWYQQRFQRVMERLKRRLSAVTHERVRRMGTAGPRAGQPPPVPRLPWNYGAQIRGLR